MLNNTPHHAFTATYGGLVDVLITNIQVGYPIVNNQIICDPIDNRDALYPTHAIWDTGATNTTITRRAAQALNLKPISRMSVSGVNGQSEENVYLVGIILPNNVRAEMVRVTECSALPTGPGHPECDVLIGMDIIRAGDFAVTNVGGQTTLSFRVPSVGKVDFVTPQQSQAKKPLIRPSLGGPPPNKYTQGKRKK